LRQKYNQYYIIDKFGCSKAFQKNHKLAETSDTTFMHNRHATYRYYREKNDFAEVSKNLVRYKSENNFVELSK